MDLNFRNLTPEEIECKPTLKKNKIEVSLHIKAATCTKMLNEKVGPMNWEKEYSNGNKNCIVRIWDNEKSRFVSKEDCGGALTEIDGHKGQASNGFKRVCALGWGLGIELYTQPTILLQATDDNVTYDDRGKPCVVEQYNVKEIEYSDDKQITRCVVVNSKDEVVYDGPNEFGQSNIIPQPKKEEKLIIPDDEDVVEEEPEDDDLPDNTDGYDDGMTQDAPFSKTNYKKEFESEVRRTHVKRADVLKALGIDDFDYVDDVDEELLDTTLRKLKSMKTYGKS